MRGIYETISDRQRQKDFADKIARTWLCEVVETARAARIDYLCLREKALAALLEIKTRSISSEKFSDSIIGLDKWLTGWRMSKDLRVPFMLAIRFSDRDMFANVSEVDSVRLAISGRTDRGDPLDIAPQVYIPLANFKSF